MNTIQSPVYTDFDQWFDKYKPQLNKFHKNENEAYNGTLYDSKVDKIYVTEYAKKHPNKVWTLLTDDFGNTCITNGWHYVNREGYFITKKPWKDGDNFNVYDSDIIERYERIQKREQGFTPETTIKVKPTEGLSADNANELFVGQKVTIGYSPEDKAYVVLVADMELVENMELWTNEYFDEVQNAVDFCYTNGLKIMSEKITVWSNLED